MSPEQVSGKVLDQRSDIYSFGATLYYLITGQRHVDGSNVMDILEQQRSKPIIPPGHLRRDIPAWVSYIVGKMMEIKPDDRFESMGAVLADVKHAENNPDTFVEQSRRGPVKRFNGLPLTLPGAETSHQARVTEPIRTELPPGTGITQRKATARQKPERPQVLVPPAATSTQRTRAAAHGVLELLGEDEQVSLAHISGALKDISARLEKAEKRNVSPGMLVLLVVLSALVVVLGVVGILLWLARSGALSL
jgi:serine/threonine protein kinase